MAGRLRRRIVEVFPEPVLRLIQRARHRERLSLERPVARSAGRGIVPAVVGTFDAHAARRDVATALTGALEAADVDYVLVPAPRGGVRQIAVSAADRSAALAALVTLTSAPGWAVSPGGAARRQARVLRVRRVLAAPSGPILTDAGTACEIAFWTPVQRDDLARRDGATHTAGTLLAPSDNHVASYLSSTAWAAATTNPAHWPSGGASPDIFETREPIDLVYTWVDGADSQWQARKAAYEPDHGLHNVSAVHNARFLSRDELRYSLRSVAMYASWVRRIHIVTDAQLPDWLDTEHPKIRVVDHRDIFTDLSVLPVFNSHAIESQLHHLDGLAEHYLYLNDDMLFGRLVEPELFFQGNGIAAFFLGNGTIDLDPPSVRDLPVTSAAKNQRALLQRDFGVVAQRKFKHVAHPQHRSVLNEMEQRFPQLFAQVAASRFRHPDDVSIPASLVHYYSYMRGRAVPGDIGYGYADLGRPDFARRLDEILRNRPHMFCLNDITSEPHQFSEQDRALRAFFDEYYPLPSPFER